MARLESNGSKYRGVIIQDLSDRVRTCPGISKSRSRNGPRRAFNPKQVADARFLMSSTWLESARTRTRQGKSSCVPGPNGGPTTANQLGGRPSHHLSASSLYSEYAAQYEVASNGARRRGSESEAGRSHQESSNRDAEEDNFSTPRSLAAATRDEAESPFHRGLRHFQHDGRVLDSR